VVARLVCANVLFVLCLYLVVMSAPSLQLHVKNSVDYDSYSALFDLYFAGEDDSKNLLSFSSS